MFSKAKSEVAKAVKQMIIEPENNIRKKTEGLDIGNGIQVKWIPTDGGKEYFSGALEKWLRNRRTTHKTTVPYSPKSNGKAKNETERFRTWRGPCF